MRLENFEVNGSAWPIKFKTESKPSVCKKRNEVNDAKKDRSVYEKKMRPARSFNDKWREGQPWLVYDKQKKDH